MPPPDSTICTVSLIVAFVVAGVVQTLWLRSQVSLRFSAPLDRGRTLRGKRIFGDSKTWRGFVVMVPAVGVVFVALGVLRVYVPAFQQGLWHLTLWQYGLLGCWVGFGFMVGELPNSFLKRRLGIGPGETPDQSWARPLCFILDQVDSIVVALLALSIMVPTPAATWISLIVLGAGIHWLFNIVLFMLGVKARPA